MVVIYAIVAVSMVVLTGWAGQISLGQWGLAGVGGVVYAAVVARRMRLQTAYQAVFEDWLFHLLLPLMAYVMLVASASVAYSHERPALFTLGAAALLLLFIGIHNAWDTVMWHVFVKKRDQRQPERHQER